MRTRNADKEQLVKEQAIKMLVRDGFEGFSVNKLAKACGISVATLYIYYKDKDDLIVKIALEEANRMSETILKDFDAEQSFEEGLRQQWKNRAKYMLDNPTNALLFEQLRSSSYHDRVFKSISLEFKETMGRFMKNAVDRGEIDQHPIEVYWSVAFAPLYNLIRFHLEGRSMGGRSFILNQKTLWQTFDLVVKGLKK